MSFLVLASLAALALLVVVHVATPSLKFLEGTPRTVWLSAAGGVSVVNVSNDLPFAQARFCGAEGIENVQTASAFRDSFGQDYGVTIAEGPFAGLLARAVVVIGADGNVAYEELVPEIAQEPNYDAALAALNAAS